ncbi:adenylate cyclase class 2 [Haloactinospora alba]|uniref:Adenylate cyclase class 2 n=1 Tax=Haloactinospora alba TaxID=405555 RepID=A0A543NE74_9ACTN|nr:CYTH domain-containing protein [Haloactinospora alba]TQN27872.1 adenylate cyclase class 2 [Haloactinospora alba]TQN30147.1 adenylate cyclase class 2 [Haloactinospora alba]
MNAVEVERKRDLGSRADTVLTRLVEHGWIPSTPVAETDDYYSRPDVDFMATVECLRLRQRDDFAELTYKPPSNAATHSAEEVISKTEVNTELAHGQAQQAQQLLAALGMVHLVQVAKTRTTYHHPRENDLVVTVDEVVEVGTFAEVEILSADTGTAVTKLTRTETELELSELPPVSLPYRDLAMRAGSPLQRTGGT